VQTATVTHETILEEKETACALSLVIPVYNEKESLSVLFEKVQEVLETLHMSYEVIFVDDGSGDGSFEILQKLHAHYPKCVKVIRFRRNFGKTPALVAGFEKARGQVVITMDGDLQDDPNQIPAFLKKLDEGYDLVSGWKYPRLDPLSKIFPSRVFNYMIQHLTQVHLHDINNGFKAYRSEVVNDPQMKLYGEFHRFIPIIAHWRGYNVTEIKVKHYPRKFGVSKFGTKRFLRGFIDLLNILFLTTFLRMPLRLFGPLGFSTFLAGVCVDAIIVFRSRFVPPYMPIHSQPMLIVGILLMIFGIQFVLTGFQSEMIRHYAFQRGEEYSIRQELF
jgi:glycosyltransferase involved in cell wall biosynthesis